MLTKNFPRVKVLGSWGCGGRTLLSRRGLPPQNHQNLLLLNVLFKITGLIMTEDKALTFFTEEELSAIGTLFICRHIPRGKIAGRILFTAIKYRLVFTVFHNYFRATLGTRNAYITCFLLCKATSGET